MRKLFLAALMSAALPWGVAAQVEKQVEVTKAYVPSVESAVKLAVAPDMTDTVTLRPEIDYTITPLSLRTALATRPIRPVSVTYWEFNRPRTAYLKVGAGFPLNSVLDFYIATQNPSTGYAVGYVNHEGRYASIRNDFDVKNTSWHLQNRVGAAAGKYFGKRTLEGEVLFDHRIDHLYGLYGVREDPDLKPGDRVNYGDAALNLRFGDDFQDLTRLNFEVELHGNLFSGNPDADRKYGELLFGLSGRLAQGWGRNSLAFGVGYDLMSGRKGFDGSSQQLFRIGLHYALRGGTVQLEAGAEYYHDRVERAADPEAIVRSGDYLIPAVRLDFNLGTPALKPFIEFDGSVRPNDARNLARENPYLDCGMWANRSTVEYNGRIGVGGSLWRDRFAYRVYAGVSVRDNRLYWYSDAFRTGAEAFTGGFFQAVSARMTVSSVNLEFEYRPNSILRIDAGLHGYIYNDDENVLYALDRTLELENGEPAFEGHAGLHYEGRKVVVGVQALLESGRSWTLVTRSTESSGTAWKASVYEVPFGIDLRLLFEWKLSQRVGLFAEGRNLANRRLYRIPWYPEYGANFTLGAKINF